MGEVKKAEVSCCYCGDKSFIFDFHRGSYASGFGKEVLVNYYGIIDNGIPELELTAEDIKQETIISGMQCPEEGLWKFKTSKAQ
jgi:hypothetical protein